MIRILMMILGIMIIATIVVYSIITNLVDLVGHLLYDNAGITQTISVIILLPPGLGLALPEYEQWQS